MRLLPTVTPRSIGEDSPTPNRVRLARLAPDCHDLQRNHVANVIRRVECRIGAEHQRIVDLQDLQDLKKEKYQQDTKQRQVPHCVSH